MAKKKINVCSWFPYRQSFIAPNLICWFKQQGLEKEDIISLNKIRKNAMSAYWSLNRLWKMWSDVEAKLNLSIPEEGYSRNVLWALNLISMFLFQILGLCKLEQHILISRKFDWIIWNEVYFLLFIFSMLTRNPAECDKPIICPIPGCKKRYKNINGMKYHARNGHKKDLGYDMCCCFSVC